MKLHTTNYKNTFIEIAEDCKATQGEIPPNDKSPKSIAVLQFEMIIEAPYQYTSDDILFAIFAGRNNIATRERVEARLQVFSKGQACLRSSPLAKRYGWGFHCDENEKVAIYAMDSKEYQKYIKEKNIKVVKAMRSKKA